MAAQPNGPIAGQDAGASGYNPGANPTGVWGDCSSGYGVYGSSNSGAGVRGISSCYAGVEGYCDSGAGVLANSVYANAIHAVSLGAGAGVYGRSDGGGFAGYFEGFVTVTQDLSASGNINKGGSCNFKIDHPVDPANRYLYHCAVESPDMKNIYDGVVTLDSAGESVVELPAWFEPLNQDYRYQLTPVGAPGPNLYVAEKIRGSRFKIAGGQPGMEVSWQVTGIRHDVYAEAHRSPVEQDKPEAERGLYLHPELFDEPPEKSIEWARQDRIWRIRDSQAGTYPGLYRGLRGEGSAETREAAR